MARIETYVPDNQVTENDIVIGSDGDNFNKTKNFRVSALTQFVEQQDVNLSPKVVTTVVGVNETIESKLQDIDLTVLNTENPVLLSFLKEEQQSDTGINIFVKYIYLFPLGNGIYNPVSDHVSIDDLLLIEKSNITSSDVDDIPNTLTIDLGDITGSTLSATVNASNPSLNLSDNTLEYFFVFEDNNSSFLFKFVGTNGFYGVNDLQSTSSDFVSFTDNDIDDDNVKAKYVKVNLGSTKYTTESDEIEEVVRQVNLLNPKVTISEKELFVVYSDSLTNDVENNYMSVYLVNTGKGIYGNDATQITEPNVLKIRGEQINENLSSFINDVPFATQSALTNGLNGKVSKSGDSMSGNLNMSSTNKVINSASPTDNGDLVNKNYADSLVNFKGDYSSEVNLKDISSPSVGDYATLTNSNAEQVWGYQNEAWRILSAKAKVVDVSANTEITNAFHNATLNITGSNITISLPDNNDDGLNFFIRNFSGTTLNISTSGVATANITSLFDKGLASVIHQNGVYTIDTNSVDSFEDINIGVYYYNDNQGFQSYLADTFITLSNNGEGSDTYKDPLTGIPDIYNISTDRFDFSGLSINDIVDLRIDLDINTTTASETVDCDIVLGEGQAGEYSIPLISSKYYKNSGNFKISVNQEIDIKNNTAKDNPAFIRLKGSASSRLTVIGFYAKVIKRG